MNCSLSWIIADLCLLKSFTGVVVVSLSDSSSSFFEPSNLLVGDFLALVSAIVYGLYVTLLKVRIHFESRIDMQLFFGFVGLFNVLTCWVVGALLHLLKIEPFELPTSNAAIKAIILNVRDYQSRMNAKQLIHSSRCFSPSPAITSMLLPC